MAAITSPVLAGWHWTLKRTTIISTSRPYRHYFRSRIRTADSFGSQGNKAAAISASRAIDSDAAGFESHPVEVRRLLLNPSFGEQLRELTRSNNIVSRSVTKQSPGALPVEPVKASEA
jgi:hypothetical protein